MKILAIETSCDETAISLLEATETASGAAFVVHGNITHSQIDVHTEYGGVFPALGKREHQKNLVPILLKILGIEGSPGTNDRIAGILNREPELLAQMEQFVLGIQKPDIDRICVTSGPGLEPALWVGINFAKALGILWDIPVVPVNHMEGHILSVLAPDVTNQKNFEVINGSINFPALALLISGGHTELVLVKNIGEYEIVGKTRDDAVGEAFDKVARVLGLPYPGGPEISKIALIAKKTTAMDFPRPMIKSENYDFSFSGLKTAVLYFVKKITEQSELTISNAFADRGWDANLLTDDIKADIAYEFQEAVTEVLVAKTKRAIQNLDIQTLIIGGGVAANKRILQGMQDMISSEFPETKLLTPARELATDNSLMIAMAGYYKIKNSPETVYSDIKANGNLIL